MLFLCKIACGGGGNDRICCRTLPDHLQRVLRAGGRADGDLEPLGVGVQVMIGDGAWVCGAHDPEALTAFYNDLIRKSAC